MDDTNLEIRLARPFAYLHIGKTGGSSIRGAIRRNIELTGEHNVSVFGHGSKLSEFLELDPKPKLCFTVREPVSRFISGFNSRLRGGRLGTSDWKPREVQVFKRFATPNELAEALSAEDMELRREARASMKALGHLRRDLSFHLGSIETLELARDRIVFIGHLPTLGDDYKVFRDLVGLDKAVELPSDEVEAHRSPGTLVKTLSALGERNVRRYYRTDYPIYEWCLERRQELLQSWSAGDL